MKNRTKEEAINRGRSGGISGCLTVVNVCGVIRCRFVQVRPDKTCQGFEGFEVQVACLLTALQRAQAQTPTEPKAEEALQR